MTTIVKPTSKHFLGRRNVHFLLWSRRSGSSRLVDRRTLQPSLIYFNQQLDDLQKDGYPDFFPELGYQTRAHGLRNGHRSSEVIRHDSIIIDIDKD